MNNRRVIYIGEHDGMGVEPYFVDGMKVEIKGDDGDSNEGIWFPAIILKSLGIRNYVVQYQTLKNEYGTQLHEEAFAPCMRPSPLVIQRRDPFKPFDKVDAWHNNGWCVGQVHKVYPSRNYSVYFNATNEMLEFQHFELRPHQDWIHGQWVLAMRVCFSATFLIMIFLIEVYLSYIFKLHHLTLVFFDSPGLMNPGQSE